MDKIQEDRLRDANEAHRLACVLRIAQASSNEHGEDMIRAAGMLDRLIYLPAITRSASREEVMLVYSVIGDTHSETTGSQWLVGTFPTADEASAAAIAEREARPECDTTIYIGSVAVPATPAPDSEKLREALEEARRQLDYLDGRFPTGTTPAVLAKIDAALRASL